MNMLRSIATAFSMFSVIPMPRVEWRKENMRLSLAALPLVGVAVGLMLRLWLTVCDALSFGALLYAAGMTLLPVAISGGVHLDGLCDTLDARSSHASPERKREILKDPRVGAFAVIGVACYFLLCLAVVYELPRVPQTAWILALVQVMSRAAGALASAVFPRTNADGLLSTFHDAADRIVLPLLIGWLIVCTVGLIVLGGWAGAGAALAVALNLWRVRRVSEKEFGGMSGDLAGWCMQSVQLWASAAFLIVSRCVALWA